MTCPEATGSCTTTPDGACTTPKIEDSLNQLNIESLMWNGDGVDIVYSTDVSFPTQTVTCWARKDREKLPYIRTSVSRDVGAIATPTGFIDGDVIEIFLRPETATEVGDWQMITYTENVTIYPSLDFRKLENSQYIGVIV